MRLRRLKTDSTSSRGSQPRFSRAFIYTIFVAQLALAPCVLTLAPSSSLAAEEGAAEGGGGGGGKNGFSAHLAKMTALQRETEELEEQIKKLVAEKREADDETQVRNMTNEIAQKYKTLTETGKKFEDEANLIRFKFPEQADKLERKYIRFTSKSLKQIEGEVGIDAKLDKIHEQVLATFPVPEIEAAKKAPPKISPIFLRKPASVDDEDVPEKIVLTK